MIKTTRRAHQKTRTTMPFHPYVSIQLTVKRSADFDVIISSPLLAFYILLRNSFWFVSSDICKDHRRQISNYVLA
jgi:hypothetical protein